MRWQNCHLKRGVHHCMQWQTPTPRSSAGLVASGQGRPGWAAQRAANPRCPRGGWGVWQAPPTPPPPHCPGAGPRHFFKTFLFIYKLYKFYVVHFLKLKKKKLWDENLGLNFFFSFLFFNFFFLGLIICYFW
jgi:hypothetical protein